MIKLDARFAAVATCAFLGLASRLDGAVTMFPNDSVVNIQLPPYSVNASDTLDDTAKIRQAIDDHLGTGRIIYFPSGTYYVSDTLLWRKTDTSGWGAGWQAYLSFQGQDKATTIIRLRSGSFTNTAAPKSVIYTGSQNPRDASSGTGNQAFNNYIRNLSIVIERNNPGAIGINLLASNRGGLFDVDVRSEAVSPLETQPLAGISMERPYPGPCLLKNVSVTGCVKGIILGQQVDSVTCENITLSGQTLVGIHNMHQCLTIRNFTCANTSGPALQNDAGVGFVTILNGRFTGGPGDKYAINNWTDGLYARAVSSSGYKTVIGYKSGPVGNSGVAEYIAAPSPYQLFPSPPRSLHLPVEETPDFHTNVLSDWANVTNPLYGAIPNDGIADTAAIRAAMNSGKSTVYFPTAGQNGVPNSGYHIDGTITVPAHVRRIIGMESHVKVMGPAFSNAAVPAPVFHFVGTNPVSVESISLRSMGSSPGAIWLGQANPQLTVKSSHLTGTVLTPYRNMDSTPRKLFLEDTVGGNWTFAGTGLSVWARQFNVENSGLKATNNGAKLWVLGIKTEELGTVIHTQGGGQTEVLGGLLYRVDEANDSVPAFSSIDSSQSLVFCTSADTLMRDYNVLVSETRGGVTNTLLHSSLIPRLQAGVRVPLFVGYPQPLYYTDFTGANSTTPAGWSIQVGNSASVRTVDNNYQYESLSGAHQNARVVYDASAGWTNYTVSSNIRADVVGNHLGVMARVQSSGDYYVAYLYGNNQFLLARFKGGGIQTLASKIFNATPYVPGERWKISLKVQGSQLTAGLYNALGNPVAELSAVNTEFASGKAGIKGVCTDAGRLVWEDFEVRQ